MKFRTVFERGRSNQLALDVGALAGGSAAAQFIAAAFAPLLTRVYGPEAFGVHGVFLSLLAVGGTIAALAYPLAIVLPREERESLAIVKLSACTSLLMSIALAALLISGGPAFARAIGADKIPGYWFVLPVGILLSGLIQIGSQWLIRRRAFAASASINVVNALGVGIGRLLVGLPHPYAGVLIGVTLAGLAAQSAMLGYASLRRLEHSREPKTREARSMVEVARRHIDFPAYRAPQNFINAASRGLPVILLASFVGPTSAGLYALATLAMGAPSNLLGKAVNDALYPRIAHANSDGLLLTSRLARATGILMLAGLLPYALVVAAGPWLFATVFGETWAKAGEYARWLTLFYYFNLINKPAVAAVPVLRRQGSLLVYELVSTGAKIAALVLGLKVFGSDVTAVALFSVVGALSYIWLILWILSCTRRHDASLDPTRSTEKKTQQW